jgi:hypothetical protein
MGAARERAFVHAAPKIDSRLSPPHIVFALMSAVGNGSNLNTFEVRQRTVQFSPDGPPFPFLFGRVG